MTQKADAIQIARCNCGRIALVLVDEDELPFASAELDPDQWAEICKKLLELNATVDVDNLIEHPQ